MDNLQSKVNAYFAQGTFKQDSCGKVTDVYLRKMLIDAAVKLEKMSTKEGAHQEKWGLKIRYAVEQKSPKLPAAYIFEYRINSKILSMWLKEHDYLLDGPLTFTARGIQFIYNSRTFTDWEQAAYVIDYERPDGTTGKQFLDLAGRGATFVATRDSFNNQDWLVLRLN